MIVAIDLSHDAYFMFISSIDFKKWTGGCV